MEIYIIRACCGSHDCRGDWDVAVFLNEETAISYLSELNHFLDENDISNHRLGWEGKDEWKSYSKGKDRYPDNPYDSKMKHYWSPEVGVEYYIEKIPLIVSSMKNVDIFVNQLEEERNKL